MENSEDVGSVKTLLNKENFNNYTYDTDMDFEETVLDPTWS